MNYQKFRLKFNELWSSQFTTVTLLNLNANCPDNFHGEFGPDAVINYTIGLELSNKVTHSSKVS